MDGPWAGGPVPFAVFVAYFWLVIWMFSELLFRLSTRTAGARPTFDFHQDRGSFVAIVVSIWVALSVSFAFDFFGTGPCLPTWVVIPGSTLVALGIFVRGWALTTLGRFFSVVVRTSADQRLVTSGPYRRIRHPSYTGNLLTTLGIGLILGTLFGIVVTVVVVPAAHLYRIKVEEQALLTTFPVEYPAYIARTWRLIPGLY